MLQNNEIRPILYCIFIFCIIVTNLALWLQDVNKLTYKDVLLFFGPTLWNSLPLSVRDPSLTLTQFCVRLKTVLFCRACETLA